MSNFESVSGLSQGEVRYIRASTLEKEGTTGVVAEGLYEGTKEVEGKFGPQTIIEIRAANGDLLRVNSAGNLGYRMEQAISKGLKVGMPIQITYLGKSKMSSGAYKGTMAHSFDVLIDASAAQAG